ncbi:putative F-box protein [Prunus yedoensis var. nudiflora]|uniref:Putative F-box protein n=1 Tax=Prunus yedoensis var. nudiflora TaxID=2094558 RepID=A0A314Z9J3_PRUYE|nr:putative F-box protein [Prunus yedoensis var. nudiflora]
MAPPPLGSISPRTLWFSRFHSNVKNVNGMKLWSMLSSKALEMRLFVGDNYFVSVLASKFGGCQSNWIYYIDDSINFRQNVSIACDMGIYSTGSFQYVIEDESVTIRSENIEYSRIRVRDEQSTAQ